MFVNRTRELAFLNARYASQQAELVVLYGRRRGQDRAAAHLLPG